VDNGGVDEGLFKGEGGKGTWAAPRTNQPIVCLSREELARIKQSTVIKQPSDIERERKQREDHRNRKHKAASDRKKRMKEKAARAKQRAHKTDEEEQRDAEKQVILNAANDLRDEDNDAMKTLNTLGARAAAFTVREQQLKEREERLKKEVEYDHFMEKKMEIERLKDLQRREREEKLKKKKRYADKEILMKQMRGREEDRLRKIKEVELEGEVMVRQIQKNKEAEEARLKRKSEIAKEKRVEIAKENEIAIERKKLIIQRDIEADQRVVDYQNFKAKELARQEADEEERKHAAEMLCAKLRSQQQRAMDNRAEIDELRARRYQDEADRKQRAKELAEEEHRQATVTMMQDAREAQLKMRQHQMALEQRNMKKEYKDTINQAWKVADREEKEHHAKKKATTDHQAKLLEQIAEKTRLRDSTKNLKYDEGRALKKEFRLELAKLEHGRKELVNSFRKQGIKEKYLSELTKADMSKFQLR